MSKPAGWTWLVYMAGDNNLEGAGRDDLKEMQQVGSTDSVNVLVQFDTEENKTTRYRIEPKKLKTLQKMPGVDSGDPKVLTDFIKWGMKEYPAERYLIDVWNHGGGWENLPPDFDYASLRSSQPHRQANLKRIQRALFRTTVEKVHRRPPRSRAIAIDCGAQDYLDNQELRTALARALPRGKRVDILGCDACLMNMVEVAYEMKGTAAYMVGSEETEPGAGWPYAAILGKLVRKPSMPPEDLCKIIVTEYGRWFRQHPDVATQSAVDLGRLDPLADAINRLADAFLADLDGVAGSVLLARSRAQKFEYPEYIDLGDFARQVTLILAKNEAVTAAANEALARLGGAGEGAVVVSVAVGATVRKATGLSIYFPEDRTGYSQDYRGLLMAKAGRWRRFLERLLEV